MERQASSPQERLGRAPKSRKAGSAHARPPQGHAPIPRHRQITPRPSLPNPTYASRQPATSTKHSSHSVPDSSIQPTRKESAVSAVFDDERILYCAKLVGDRSHRIKESLPCGHPRSNALVEKDCTGPVQRAEPET